MSRVGRYLLCEVAGLARFSDTGRDLSYGVAVLARRPLRAVLAAFCCLQWLRWPVSVAGMSRIGRYLLSEVAALARVGGRDEPYWPLFAV